MRVAAVAAANGKGGAAVPMPIPHSAKGGSPVPSPGAVASPGEGGLAAAGGVGGVGGSSSPPSPSPSPSVARAPSSGSGFDPLVRLLQSLQGGAYASEGLLAHVGLAHSLLLATERRLLYVHKGSGELLWQVPVDQLAGAEQDTSASKVILRLGVDPTHWEAAEKAPTRTIDCLTPAVVPLVLETVKQAQEAQAAQAEATRYN